ncbi:MAG: serine/threonine-protein kinase [Myxococcota bacterium]
MPSPKEASTRLEPVAASSQGENGADDVLVGQVLNGQYQIIRRLGAGGMGNVYEAEPIERGGRVAVKILQSSLCSNEKYRKRFLREAKAARAIASDHVVKIFDAGATQSGILYFTMEKLEGCDFEQFLDARDQVYWDEIAPVFFQVLDALRAAHERGVIHRDIKPSNCFLCDGYSREGPLVKVLDFGIAKINASVAGGEDIVATVESLTATNEMFGTVAYMAPELIEGVPADARSDIYAVGVMMFRALTGRLPYAGANVYKVLQQQVNSPIPSVRSIAPEVSPALESVVFRAMAKNPGHRYQNVAELDTALRAAQKGILEPSVEGLSGGTQALWRGAAHGSYPQWEQSAGECIVTTVSGALVAQGPAAQGPAAQGPAAQGPAVQGPAAQGPAEQGPAVQGPSGTKFPRTLLLGVFLTVALVSSAAVILYGIVFVGGPRSNVAPAVGDARGSMADRVERGSGDYDGVHSDDERRVERSDPGGRSDEPRVGVAGSGGALEVAGEIRRVGEGEGEGAVAAVGGEHEMAVAVEEPLNTEVKPKTEVKKKRSRSPRATLARHIEIYCRGVTGSVVVRGWVGLDGRFTKLDRVSGGMPGDRECISKWARKLRFEPGKRRRETLEIFINRKK